VQTIIDEGSITPEELFSRVDAQYNQSLPSLQKLQIESASKKALSENSLQMWGGLSSIQKENIAKSYAQDSLRPGKFNKPWKYLSQQDKAEYAFLIGQQQPPQGLLSMGNLLGDTLPAPRNEAEAIAKNILELRATGNVDAVTESMINAADPQYMYNYTPLPMDYASRMRRAIQQGFDVNDEMYRGDAPRQAFETGSGQRDQIGVTASSVPDVAASYIPAKGEGGIYPLFSRGQNDAVIEAGGQNWNVILPNTPVRFQGEQSRLDEYIPVNQYFEPYDVLAETAFFDTNDLSRIFQGYGADRVRFNKIVDRGGSAKYYGPQSSVPSDVTMVANPANVRSRFARFDPMFSNLSNLSAGVAISPLAYGLLSNQYERKKRQ
jgi:hypothetical protein